MYVCMYVCMYGWMDGWMDVYVCMCVCVIHDDGGNVGGAYASGVHKGGVLAKTFHRLRRVGWLAMLRLQVGSGWVVVSTYPTLPPPFWHSPPLTRSPLSLLNSI